MAPRIAHCPFSAGVIRWFAVLSAFLVLGVVPAEGEDDPARIWVLPFEIDADFGAANGNAIIGRFMPIKTIKITERWKLVNIAMVQIAHAPGGRPGGPGNPEPVPGPKVFGLGDLTDAVVLSPNNSRSFQWGVGLAVGVPTATDPVLGSGKWQLGPAFRLSWVTDLWRVGVLAADRWSVAGDPDRAETHQLLARGLIRRRLGERWFFISAPIITANWNAPSGQRWLVPLGGGVGRSFDFRPTRMNLSFEVFANVIKPDGAPDWVARFGMTFPFRIPERGGR